MLLKDHKTRREKFVLIQTFHSNTCSQLTVLLYSVEIIKSKNKYKKYIFNMKFSIFRVSFLL